MDSVQVMTRQRQVMRGKHRMEMLQDVFRRRPMGDCETARWLNQLVRRMWPVCLERCFSDTLIPAVAPWFFQRYKPWHLVSLATSHHATLPPPLEVPPLILAAGMRIQSTCQLEELLLMVYACTPRSQQFSPSFLWPISPALVPVQKKAWLERLYLGSNPPFVTSIRMLSTNLTDDHAVSD